MAWGERTHAKLGAKIEQSLIACKERAYMQLSEHTRQVVLLTECDGKVYVSLAYGGRIRTESWIFIGLHNLRIHISTRLFAIGSNFAGG